MVDGREDLCEDASVAIRYIYLMENDDSKTFAS